MGTHPIFESDFDCLTEMLRLLSKNGARGVVRHLAVTPNNDKIIQFFLSDIGEGTKEVVVKEWFVTEGQEIEEFDELVEVQSDKATVPITSRYSGKVVKLHYDLEDVALVGKALVDLEVEDDGDDEPVDHFEQKKEETKAVKKTATSSSSGAKDGKVKAKPAVRKFAKDNGININDVVGTGPKGIVTKEDVQSFMSAPAATATPAAPQTVQHQAPQVAASVPVKELPQRASTTSGGEHRVALGPIAKAMTKTMNLSNQIPHFGYKDEYDMTNLAGLRKELKPMAAEFGIKLSYMPFIIKAVSMALNDYPVLNARMTEDETALIYHDDHNIGVAVDTPHGLLVPNIKGVQNMSVLEIASELGRLAEAGRVNKLSPKDIGGGTFSLSNIGAIGGTYAKPILVPPQVAIGAIGKIQRLPRFDENDQVVARQITYISWSADHRCIEGAVMARFSNKMKAYLEQPASMLLHTR